MSDDLLELLALAPDGEGAFTTVGPGEGFLYGGFVLAAALKAACATVDPELTPHSVHATFLRTGDWGQPLRLEVERTREGRAFAARRVQVVQGGKVVVTSVFSFHRGEDGPDWQAQPFDAGDPPESYRPVATRMSWATDPIEIRPIHPGHADGELPQGTALHPYWARVRHDLPDDPVSRLCGLAFLSDYVVIYSSSPPPVGLAPGNRAVTLEHALWFHRPLGPDPWWRFDAEPLTTNHGRALVRGAIHDRAGGLVASFVQEVLVRSSR